MDARGIRTTGPALRNPRQETERNDPRAAGIVARWLGVLERRVLSGSRADDRTASRGASAHSVRRGVRGGAAPRGTAVRRLGRLRLRVGRRGRLRAEAEGAA